jgi:hypothetical protein
MPDISHADLAVGDDPKPFRRLYWGEQWKVGYSWHSPRLGDDDSAERQEQQWERERKEPTLHWNVFGRYFRYDQGAGMYIPMDGEEMRRAASGYMTVWDHEKNEPMALPYIDPRGWQRVPLPAKPGGAGCFPGYSVVQRYYAIKRSGDRNQQIAAIMYHRFSASVLLAACLAKRYHDAVWALNDELWRLTEQFAIDHKLRLKDLLRELPHEQFERKRLVFESRDPPPTDSLGLFDKYDGISVIFVPDSKYEGLLLLWQHALKRHTDGLAKIGAEPHTVMLARMLCDDDYGTGLCMGDVAFSEGCKIYSRQCRADGTVVGLGNDKLMEGGMLVLRRGVRGVVQSGLMMEPTVGLMKPGNQDGSYIFLSNGRDTIDMCAVLYSLKYHIKSKKRAAEYVAQVAPLRDQLVWTAGYDPHLPRRLLADALRTVVCKALRSHKLQDDAGFLKQGLNVVQPQPEPEQRHGEPSHLPQEKVVRQQKPELGSFDGCK